MSEHGMSTAHDPPKPKPTLNLTGEDIEIDDLTLEETVKFSGEGKIMSMRAPDEFDKFGSVTLEITSLERGKSKEVKPKKGGFDV